MDLWRLNNPIRSLTCTSVLCCSIVLPCLSGIKVPLHVYFAVAVVNALTYTPWKRLGRRVCCYVEEIPSSKISKLCTEITQSGLG